MAMLGGKREEGPSGVARINPADAHTILGREARFNGKLTFEGAVRIDGKFEGEIYTNDLLLVGPGAEVKARLEVGSVVINGIVEGDVVAKSSVEIKAPGKLKGNVTTPSLSVEKGVIFDGTCTMSKAVSSNGARPNEKKAEAAAAPSKS
ncbi:MAG: polymer-forming cytoskeletal protein [Myxococcota bacterium]